MKKIIALLLALTLVFALCACGNKDDTQAGGDENTVYIGVYEPASGDNGAGGKQEALGIEYANYLTPKVEIGGKEYNVKLISVDNESSTDKAPSAANTLVSSNVSVVLGSYGSSVAIAAGDIFAKAQIPAIGVTCTNPQVTEGNDYYFRICFLDPFQGTVLANYASKDLKATKAYCLSKMGDDYSGGLCNYFIEAFEALGGEVVHDTFPDGNSDFASYVANAKNAGADVIFAPVSTEAAALIIEQCDTQGIEIPILAGDTWDSNVILAAAKGTDVRVDVTTFFIEGSEDEQVTSFVDGFKAWLEENPDKLANNGGNTELAAVTAMGFDAYYTALEALKAAGSTKGTDVQKALWDVTYTGVCGEIKFDSVNGDAERDVAYVKTVNNETGAWEFVTVAQVD